MASGSAEYTMAKHAIKDLEKALPRCCAKCGGTSFELVEDGIQCINDGWIYYLSDEQIDTIKREGLDKMNPVCKDRCNGKEA